MSQPLHVVCPRCDAVNRVPPERLAEDAKCGKCRSPLFPGAPLALNEERFARHLGRGDLPLVVDFWAPWCGPCRMMAPVFEAVARRIEPRARLVKVNTEEAQGLATRHGIRSIPTLVVFRGGKEVARTSGAMDAGSLETWIRRQI